MPIPLVSSDRMEWSHTSGEAEMEQQKVLHQEGGLSLDWAPQGSGHSAKPLKSSGHVWTMPSIIRFSLGSPVRSKELD